MNSFHRVWPAVLALLAAMLVVSCAAPTRTEVSVEPGSRALQGGSGGLVLFPSFRGQESSGDAEVMRCLKKELAKRVPHPFRIVDTAVFQDALFPWFEANHAPRTVAELNALLERPLVRERIASLGVRYLLVIAGVARADGFPGMICGAGYGGGGCLGAFSVDSTYRAQAVIWDIAQGVESGIYAATSSGKSVGVALGIPFMFIADTQREACQALANELSRVLADVGQSGK
jgi:hypothetical protein